LQAVQASAQESLAELEEPELAREVVAETATAGVEEPEREVAAIRSDEAPPTEVATKEEAEVPTVPVEKLTADALTLDDPEDAPSELMTGSGPGKVYAALDLIE
jgi:hypothetical protein